MRARITVSNKHHVKLGRIFLKLGNAGTYNEMGVYWENIIITFI